MYQIQVHHIQTIRLSVKLFLQVVPITSFDLVAYLTQARKLSFQVSLF